MVSPHESKTITGHTIVGWFAHTEKYACAYLTAAADVGMSKRDIDLFLKRFDKNFQTVLSLFTTLIKTMRRIYQ